METERTEPGLQYGAHATYRHGNNLYINMTNLCPNRCDFCLRQNSPGRLYSTISGIRGASQLERHSGTSCATGT